MLAGAMPVQVGDADVDGTELVRDDEVNMADELAIVDEDVFGGT